MRLDEIFKVPKGKFRVFGRDNSEEEFFIVRDLESFSEAIATAILKEGEEAEINGRGNEIASSFYVIDNKLNFLYGILET